MGIWVHAFIDEADLQAFLVHFKTAGVDDEDHPLGAPRDGDDANRLVEFFPPDIHDPVQWDPLEPLDGRVSE